MLWFKGFAYYNPSLQYDCYHDILLCKARFSCLANNNIAETEVFTVLIYDNLPKWQKWLIAYMAGQAVVFAGRTPRGGKREGSRGGFSRSLPFSIASPNTSQLTGVISIHEMNNSITWNKLFLICMWYRYLWYGNCIEKWKFSTLFYTNTVNTYVAAILLLQIN